MNCIITGGSRGLGKAMAERFAAGGYDLYLTSQNDKLLLATQQELIARYPGVRVYAKAADLGAKTQAEAFARWLLDTGVAVDVLVNNAGLFLPGSVHSEPDGTLERL